MQGKIADTLNDVIERNERLTGEIERISNVVGKEGKLSQRAQVPDGGGAWSSATDAVNSLIIVANSSGMPYSSLIGAMLNSPRISRHSCGSSRRRSESGRR